jgi:hypothetical protein
MAVPHKLPCFLLGSGKTHSLNNVIKPSFEKLQKVVARNALHSLSLLKITAKLALQHTVDAPNFLFFPELYAIFRLFDSRLAMLSRRIASSGDSAFIRIATLGFQKELRPLSPAKLTD